MHSDSTTICMSSWQLPMEIPPVFLLVPLSKKQYIAYITLVNLFFHSSCYYDAYKIKHLEVTAVILL